MIAPRTAEHAHPDCTGTWVFAFDLPGVSHASHAQCTGCGIVTAWFTCEEDVEPYRREAMLHAHLLAGRA